MKKSAVVALILAAISLAACGEAAAEPLETTAAPSSTTTSALPPAFPGTYVTSVTQEDIDSAGAENRGLAGEWRITFAAAEGTATYEASLNDTQVWQGTFTIAGDVFKITTAGTGEDCVGEGTYTWTFDGTQLVLATESDSCVNRTVILSAHPLVRQQ